MHAFSRLPALVQKNDAPTSEGSALHEGCRLHLFPARLIQIPGNLNGPALAEVLFSINSYIDVR
jgi:hypothetical protein